MRIERFEWDKTNRSHLTRHKVTPEEAEEIFVLCICAEVIAVVTLPTEEL
jgi:uncharacterized DUF497 family protein